MPELNKQQFEAISEIANRAMPLFADIGVKVHKIDLVMDLEYANQDIPLDFEKLRDFPDLSFSHDVFGIYRHFNRDTLKMEDCFLPRCALPA